MKEEKSAVISREKQEETRLAKRAVFDVVNSVKGGSGKSTFSLLLAAYYNSTPGTVAYVLDLDLRGTSWEKNYGQYMSTPFFETKSTEKRDSLWNYGKAWIEKERVQKSEDEPLSEDDKAYNKDIRTKKDNYRKYPFINALMWDFGHFQSGNFWTEIPFKMGSRDGVIKLCPARTSNGEKVEQIEVDIFEHTIYQLICHILDAHRDNDGLKEVHIILDMPPSYEKHAEAVLKHLLANEESDLFQRAKKSKNQFSVHQNDATKYYLPYEIRLYMMCARNPAHIEQNGAYLYHWLEKRKYSDTIMALLKDDKATVKTQSGEKIMLSTETIRRFLIRFVVNDISGNFWESKIGRRDSSDPVFGQYNEWAKQYFTMKEMESSSFYLLARKRLDPENTNLITYCAFPHVNLPATYWEMEAENAPKNPIIEIDNSMVNPLEYVEKVILKNSDSKAVAD